MGRAIKKKARRARRKNKYDNEDEDSNEVSDTSEDDDEDDDDDDDDYVPVSKCKPKLNSVTLLQASAGQIQDSLRNVNPSEVVGSWGRSWSASSWWRGCDVVLSTDGRAGKTSKFPTFFSPCKMIGSQCKVSPPRTLGICAPRPSTQDESVLVTLVEHFRSIKQTRKKEVGDVENILRSVLTDRQRRYLGISSPQHRRVTLPSVFKNEQSCEPKEELIWIGLLLVAASISPPFRLHVDQNFGIADWKQKDKETTQDAYTRASNLAANGSFHGAILILEQNLKSRTHYIRLYGQGADKVVGVDYMNLIFLCNHFALEHALGGNIEGAVRLLDRAMNLTTKGEWAMLSMRPALRILTMHSFACIARLTMQAQLVLDYLQRALKIARRSKLPECEGVTWVNLGTVHSRSGRSESAISCTRAGLDILNKHASEAASWLVKSSSRGIANNSIALAERAKSALMTAVISNYNLALLSRERGGKGIHQAAQYASTAMAISKKILSNGDELYNQITASCSRIVASASLSPKEKTHSSSSLVGSDDETAIKQLDTIFEIEAKEKNILKRAAALGINMDAVCAKKKESERYQRREGDEFGFVESQSDKVQPSGNILLKREPKLPVTGSVTPRSAESIPASAIYSKGSAEKAMKQPTASTTTTTTPAATPRIVTPRANAASTNKPISIPSIETEEKENNPCLHPPKPKCIIHACVLSPQVENRKEEAEMAKQYKAMRPPLRSLSISALAVTRDKEPTSPPPQKLRPSSSTPTNKPSSIISLDGIPMKVPHPPPPPPTLRTTTLFKRNFAFALNSVR